MHKGDVAPDFELLDQSGTPVRLSTLLAEGPVVLFFYPLAMSGGCTAEVCHFGDLSVEFQALGAHRVGISRDSVERQAEFARKTGISYPLLSDPQETVIGEYGVKRRLLAKVLPVKRSTFVIGQNGTILDVISSETDMRTHADRALRVLGQSA
ncbi:peroxiredoxin [Psychromicrobium xiongbiense]|uniref:peroxiredoxin n=1 Tax=Psychromicrobium xiongbiense TaxID=3051184 RepID=UPI002552668A|nr:peroxiredoxin [Psychromicrobium sp. YIM S02556]